ncbi:hypothetical protein ISN45_Aa07g029420 [Arabidopsis thaliana x Arabidopsis arenosa]|uniref:Uncharacterized protein n=1 Tax=Arabidopsis thaliana x Arabidopsis arenosa TaxID=1240361 RepID=A0A8T1YBT3_9BRAS|nr:hypothetical protein ISN45_Aa07g029420 [Arabidopsis thaliana x Arabidopsis arenosa]
MDSQDHCNSPGGGKSCHVCTKCGWSYPNPHPSAKNRRAHKKICGTIKGFEIFDSDKAKQNLDLQEEHCLVDELKTPSPIVVEKAADERIGDVSEEDVFTDAVCEFSRSDSFKEETATNFAAKGTENPGETQQCNNSSTACVMKSSEVVQESCEVPLVEVEVASDNRQGAEHSTEGHSMASETVIASSQEAQVIDSGDTLSNVKLETEGKGNLPDKSESKLASALGKREDTSDSSWNDEVIYSDVEGPSGFSSEATSMTHPGEASCIVSEDVPVHTSLVKADATQDISASQYVPDDMPFVENADVSLHGIKGLEEFEGSYPVNPSLPETSKGEECENTLTEAENLGIQPECLSIGSEVPSSDKLLDGDKNEPQNQTDLVAVKEFPSAEKIMISKVDSEDIKMNADEGESSLGNAQTVESETLRVSLPAVDSIVVDSNADVSSAANKTSLVDLVGHESELIQANVVAEDGSNPKDTLSSESSCYVSPVSVVFEGDDASDKIKSSSETSKDSALQFGAEFCESKDEVCREINNGMLVEESSFINETNTTEYPISHSGSAGTAPDDSVETGTANQKPLESERTEFNRVVGGLGVIQANEIDGNVKEHNYYAEVPVTIESNDHRDFGRLQNLSEAHIRSLVSSPLVTRNNISNAFESNLGSVSGVSGGVNKPENASQNQEITLEKATSWITGKEQHVPLKNLLSEARSPRLQQQQAKDHESNNIPRVSSILGQETSPEDGRWPEKREVSEEWNSPAKYPVDFKREEKKVKGRPFWVPFVCCSNVK